MSKSGENIDLGFRDLLFNSGVACMLLFIIFSVRMGKDIIQVENVSQATRQDFQFQDEYSLVVNETIEDGNYRSLLLVEVMGVRQEEFEEVSESGIVRWTVEDELGFISYDEDRQSMMLYNVVGQLTQPFVSLQLLSNTIISRPFTVTSRIIDGKSMLDADNNQGLFQYTWAERITLNEKEFIFRPAKLEDDQSIEHLFDVR